MIAAFQKDMRTRADSSHGFFSLTTWLGRGWNRVGLGGGNDLKVTIARALKLSASQRVMSNFTHRDMDEPDLRSF